jgi:hypothetical protein
MKESFKLKSVRPCWVVNYFYEKFLSRDTVSSPERQEHGSIIRFYWSSLIPCVHLGGRVGGAGGGRVALSRTHIMSSMTLMGSLFLPLCLMDCQAH